MTIPAFPIRKVRKKIYVILKNYHGDYWKKVIAGISDAAEEIDAAIYLGGIDNETDIDGQISLIEQAVKQDADGILLAPANSFSLVDSCHAVKEQQIPLVLIDSSINSDDYSRCYMTNNMSAGETAAQEMLSLCCRTPVTLPLIIWKSVLCRPQIPLRPW